MCLSNWSAATEEIPYLKGLDVPSWQARSSKGLFMGGGQLGCPPKGVLSPFQQPLSLA